MDTTELRNSFLIQDIFVADAVTATYSIQDRYVILGAMPVKNKLTLPPCEELTKASYFLERREAGIINVGGNGTVIVDDKKFELKNTDCLYVGKGKTNIVFESDDPDNPALFYINSALAASPYPCVHIAKSEVQPLVMGDVSTANYRKIYQYIIPGRVQSCQLVLGFTELLNGSVWNTIPPHTHLRRNEVYFYFDLPQDHIVIHLMGTENETRHLVARNHQAVVSPEWSIHAGAGTACYSFIWGMAGENQDYTDMDKIELKNLK